MTDWAGEFADRRIGLINAALDRHMPSERERPVTLHKAMRYSVFAGGKRLRPLLCLASCEALGGAVEDAILPAIAIEALHTYTLIHDDLPCMDDDDKRRGMPTCHIAFGEATAVLAGDALLTLAFEWLAQASAPPPYPPCQFALELAAAAGSRGVVGGQAEDMAAEGAEADPARVEYIHTHKTASLIRAAARIGGIAASASERNLAALSSYGGKLGLAFQIIDDILNETSTPEQLGKAAGSDRDRGKLTYVAVHGLEAAQAKAKQLSREAVEAAGSLDGNVEILVSLAETMLGRKR